MNYARLTRRHYTVLAAGAARNIQFALRSAKNLTPSSPLGNTQSAYTRTRAISIMAGAASSKKSRYPQ